MSDALQRIIFDFDVEEHAKLALKHLKTARRDLRKFRAEINLINELGIHDMGKIFDDETAISIVKAYKDGIVD